jgi:hypothetical protein
MLKESEFVICGEGYNGVADTLEAAHALAERMDGGTIYVKVERLDALEAECDRLDKQRHAYRQEYDQQRERIKELEAVLAWYAPMRDRGGKARAVLGWPEPAPFTEAELRQAAIDRALDEQA